MGIEGPDFVRKLTFRGYSGNSLGMLEDCQKMPRFLIEKYSRHKPQDIE